MSIANVGIILAIIMKNRTKEQTLLKKPKKLDVPIK
jgi:hypothetical protein